MTAHANSLTKRVTPKAPDASAPITLPAHALRVFLDGLGVLGYNPDALLATAGLRHEDFADPDARVPCEMYGRVLAGAQRERFTPNLALELARVTPLGAWPLLDYLVVTADTVGAGIQQLVRYFRLVGDPIVINIREESEAIRLEMTASVSFAIEYDAALLIIHFRNETDGRFAASRLSFQHAVDDPVGFERIVGCPVESNASWSGVCVPGESWQLPLRRRDPTLRNVLEGHANEILARLPERTGLGLEVQRALTSRIAGGDTRIDAIAREFAMSARTLQRKLADERVSYQKLLDDARKEAAGRYLSGSTLAIGEIAYLLGYSEPAPFHRAFKRWHGVTPEAFRSNVERPARIAT